MPRHGSPSPARRPQLEQKASSSRSVSKESQNAAHLSKSHKGSSTKLHKAHAVGHGRHGHSRVPSYGKGLHKLTKLGAAELEPETGDSANNKNHTSSTAHTPPGSPTARQSKRNSSQISLPRVGSKVSMKKNASTISMTKLGNQAKSEKAQTKNSLRKKGTDDAPLKGMANFSVGEDGQDDDWEEASSSQSPHTTRHSSVGRKTPQLEDPPSPDEPPGRSPTNLPQSPPQSPPTNPSAFINHTIEEGQQKKSSKYSHPLDGDEVSHRLLDRSKHNATPQISNISASVTPSGSSGSPAFGNQDSSFAKEPSMPADGISRFLGGTRSNSGSATPGSISHLHSNLAQLNPKENPSPHRPASPAESASTIKAETRRVKSAANLTHPRLSNDESSSSISPPKEQPPPSQKPPKPTKPPAVSPYESARGADPNAGKSLTQLKLDLQRMSTLQDTPSPSHPLRFQHGPAAGIQNLNASGGEMAARLARQYQQAGMEYRNARRFYPDLVVEKGLSKRVAGKKKLDAQQKGKGAKTPVAATPMGSSGARGRVRFEVGKSPGELEELEEEGAGQQRGVLGVEGLLRRMWHQGMDAGMGED